MPPGFTLTTEVCNYYSAHGGYPDGVEAQLEDALKSLEADTGKTFGDASDPLLLSVRSGARASMPGMMDTILNLGLNDETVQGVISSTGNARFAYDCYRRFVSMYGDVVLGCKPESDDEGDVFEERLEAMKKAKGVSFDTELTADDLKDLVAEFKTAVKERTGHDFPDDPRAQLWGAISAVFGSWGNDRAVAYRRMYGIPDDWGTAVNIQTMVYGNTGDESGTGVAFTRNPASGENEFYGEFLVNAQGEDVVAGVRTPRQVIELKDVWPDVYDELMAVRQTLESELRDMQDFEFTIEKGRLFMLQTRNGKRTGLAALRIAVDMADQGLITPDEALMRIEPEQLNQLLRPGVRRRREAGGGQGGPGHGQGPARRPRRRHRPGRLQRPGRGRVGWPRRAGPAGPRLHEPRRHPRHGRRPGHPHGAGRHDQPRRARRPPDGQGLHRRLRCSSTSTCAVAASRPATAIVKEGDWISIDGFTGEVIVGKLETRPSEVLQVLLEKTMTPEQSGTYRYYREIMEWADKARTLGVRTNADQPDQSANAIAFGAEGIGLCRTEHMFFEGERIMSVREMILAESREAREAALAKLLPMQRDDFAGIFRVMGERHVTIRTLDPPLHEFLPHGDKDTAETAAALGVPEDVVRAKVEDLHESNPMLGHRGCRLGIAFPEITAMQARAILEAACLVKKEGLDVHPEIMIPLVGTRKELEHQAAIVRAVAADVFAEQGVEVAYLVGTMIEIPRAALTANEIAEVAEFFSFGTNDLTQMTLGVSRDDAGKFLPLYTSEELEIWPADPFATLDQSGVGQLVEIGIERGRRTRPDLHVGICGEQGGDPETVKFCHRAGMDYVSCSPYRLPVARLAAAQAAIEERGDLRLEK